MVDGQHDEVAARAPRPGVGGKQKGQRIAAAGKSDRDRPAVSRLETPIEDRADRGVEVGDWQDRGGG